MNLKNKVFYQAIHQLLNTLITHESFFENNPKQICLLMDIFEKLITASRYHKKASQRIEENPKDFFYELENKIDKNYLAQILDCWNYVIEIQQIDLSRSIDSEFKINKTMDDYLELYLNPDYRYSSLFKNKISVIDYLFLSIGHGLKWNKSGYIEKEVGEGSVDLSLIESYWLDKINPDIDKLLSLNRDPQVLDYINKSKEASLNFKETKDKMDQSLKEIEKYFLEKGISLKKNEIKIRDIHLDYSLICKIPENAHLSYKETAIDLLKEIIKRDDSSLKNKEIAKKIIKTIKIS